MTNKEAQITINAIKFMLDNAQYSEDVEEALNMAINVLTAQPEERTNERAETHGVCLDAISRRAAISLPVKPKEDRYFQTQNLDDAYDYGWLDLQRCIEKLPPAQPDIIRCKDCKFAEVADKEDGQDGYTCQFHRGSIWFSGSYCSWAERQEE